MNENQKLAQFILENVGGKENVESATHCMTRLRLKLKDNSKANILNREVLNADNWNEYSILSRAKSLANIIINKFEYIDLHLEKTENIKLSYNVESDFDYSNTKPVEMIFLGERTKVNYWKDILATIMNTIYDLKPEIIKEYARNNYSIPNAEKIYISNDNRKIRDSKQIDNTGIYYETNLSANRIISFIRNLLYELEIDIDDFSFSLEENLSLIEE